MLQVTGNAAKPCLSGCFSHGWVAPWCSLVILSWHTVLSHQCSWERFTPASVLIHLSQVFYYIGKNLFGRVVEIMGRS